MAEALLQIASRIRAGDGSAHRALTEWMYHAGQVCSDLSSTAAASGMSPLEALALPNLLDDVSQSSLMDFDAPVYDCRFECIPASVTYRPRALTPWPVMRGSQTARVVGPSGEEIHTDEYGRVKVQFNWDREGKFDDKSSCWIRVSQGSAGGQYGMMFLLASVKRSSSISWRATRTSRSSPGGSTMQTRCRPIPFPTKKLRAP